MEESTPLFAEDTSDEKLAEMAADGIEKAERELLRRYMQAIYWLPQRAFGAPEESLSEFLLYAIEKIRARDTLSKFDSTRNCRFSTWFGVVLRRLYLDFLRAQPPEPYKVELSEDIAMSVSEKSYTDDSLLEKMQVQCRVLFKLLLCNTFYLTGEEIKWIADTSKRAVTEVMGEIATMEERMREAEADLAERYDKLSSVMWWKRKFETDLLSLERKLSAPWTEEHPEIEEVYRKMLKKKDEHERLLDQLAGSAGITTAPYHDLALIMNMKEGTLASRISRCRAGTAEFLGRDRKQNSDEEVEE